MFFPSSRPWLHLVNPLVVPRVGSSQFLAGECPYASICAVSVLYFWGTCPLFLLLNIMIRNSPACSRKKKYKTLSSYFCLMLRWKVYNSPNCSPNVKQSDWMECNFASFGPNLSAKHHTIYSFGSKLQWCLLDDFPPSQSNHKTQVIRKG
jgi:hypothetical protein